MAFFSTTTMMIAMAVSMAAAAASSIMSAQAASKAAQVQGDQANQNAQFQYTELTRQQTQNDASAAQQQSDRMRQADREQASIRVMSGESGSLGGSFDRFVSTVGYVEGMDLSRIESNRASTEAQLQSGKTAAQLGAAQTIQNANMTASNAKTSAALGFVGTSLNLGASYVGNERLLNARRLGGQTDTVGG